MKRSGYHRWLLSYLPIFFSIISVLVFIFFLAISGLAKEQALRANEVFTRNVLQTLDASLQLTEQIIVKELLTDEKFAFFFDPFQEMTPYQAFQLSKKINLLATTLQSVESIYLYRLSDHRVLTTKTMIPLEQFGDRAFVQQVEEQPLAFAWSESRVYREFGENQFSKQVVSLVKKVPLVTGSQGLIVVNVRTSSIGETFGELARSDISFMQLLDAKGQLFFGEQIAVGSNLSKIQSEYTGWTVISGMKNKKVFQFISAFSNIWLYAGIATIAFGAIWMVMVVRRNYKPIESIRESIQSYTMKKNNVQGTMLPPDEFALIKWTIENMVEQTNQYEEENKENLTYRKRWFFQQLMEGASTDHFEDWQVEMKRFGWSGHSSGWVVAVLEIDRYSDFTNTYSQGDQQLLKYVITGVIRDMTEARGIEAWSEWVNQEQVGLLFSFKESFDSNAQFSHEFCENARIWMEKYLKFTVSIGIGLEVRHIPDIAQSYDNALEALQYKTTLGSNRTIGHLEIGSLPQRQMFRHLNNIRLLAQHYRLGEDTWKQQLHDLSSSLRTAVAPRDDVISLMNYIIYALQKEIAELPEEIQHMWNQEAMPKLNEALQQFEEIAEIDEVFTLILSEAFGKMLLLRENRGNHKLIHQVKRYIEAHFANPDLSLEHLNDEFHLNIKTLSRLFKEEFGEKFVDYLAKVRIEDAKQQLKEASTLSIQQIAQKVGYNNTFTFIRVFKKLVGVTPGEYRKSQNEDS
ncbi:helix-turn-helix domain-containing protein [Paenibacillus eucommiae]|uniref:AraC-like DNA-binding protein n=1 Tax=Paenibacillus eucommiae TaxID=1355755 RepID=A0ABS4J2E1_9BACL|nr:helix-turn-helix domain-containing protein [Paenibacillus eucommiae]MBP1993421.1 AraC-like DNA-binding protein [Paenibacillus eucommiae]